MSIEKEIAEMKQAHARMEAAQLRTEAAVGRIESAIAGDSKFGTKGMLHTQAELAKVQEDLDIRILAVETYQETQTIRHGKIAAFFTLIGAGMGFLGHKLSDWLSK